MHQPSTLRAPAPWAANSRALYCNRAEYSPENAHQSYMNVKIQG